MKSKLLLEDTMLGMKVSVEQLDCVTGQYIILLYENIDDAIGTIVYIGSNQTPDYSKWF